jgi:hypothetical protein
MRFFTPRRLLRLYPGLFRLRYGAEFVALLEQTPITRAVVFDTIRAATWEWLRWTRIGRLVLALLIAAPLAVVQSALTQRWPSPLAGVLNAPIGWSSFWLTNVLFCSPFLIGTLLLICARPPSQRGRRLGFSTQVIVLSITASMSGWLLTLPTLHEPFPAVVQLMKGSWLGTASFIGVFLIWLFNIEGGAMARYPRRMGISADQGDDR